MTRAQWLLVVCSGLVALVALRRTEEIAQRIGMAGVLPFNKARSGTV